MHFENANTNEIQHRSHYLLFFLCLFSVPHSTQQLVWPTGQGAGSNHSNNQKPTTTPEPKKNRHLPTSRVILAPLGPLEVTRQNFPKHAATKQQQQQQQQQQEQHKKTTTRNKPKAHHRKTNTAEQNANITPQVSHPHLFLAGPQPLLPQSHPHSLGPLEMTR